MFAVYAMPHACELGGANSRPDKLRELRLPAVTPAQLKQLVAQFPPYYPVQRKDLGVGTRDALTEVRIILDAGYGMS
jgi:hypothetical protein